MMEQSSPTPNQDEARRSGWWSAAARYLPVVAFLAFLLYYWRIYDLGGRMTGYGDALEYVWATGWFRQGLQNGEGIRLFVPGVFMPEGWSLATFANGLGVFALAVPITFVLNGAAAFNILVLLSFVVAYVGIYRLVRLTAGRGVAALMGLLYLLWGGRWLRISGHLHILLGSALLPWIILCLEGALKGGRRWWLWATAAGLLWALAISFSMYFIWFGLFLVAGWLLGAVVRRRVAVSRGLLILFGSGGVAALVSLPYFYLYLRAGDTVKGFNIQAVNIYNLSLDWLPALFPHHPIPVLAEFAMRQTNGAPNEAAFSGFGIILLILAAVGLTGRARRPDIRAAAAITAGIGIVLALGPILQWNGEPVALPALRPLNEAIWDVGHTLKPDIFSSPDAPPAFATGVPLPGLLLSATVPYFEGARVSARYLLIAAPGVLLLAAMALEKRPRRRLVALAAGLLLIEAARTPVRGLPFPVPAHPAFAWLAAHPVAPGESVLDLHQPLADIALPIISGDALWATTMHRQPIAGGGGSVLPLHFNYLLGWFAQHPNPVDSPELPWLLRGYGVRYVLLHFRKGDTAALEALAAGSDDIAPVDCFAGAPGSPWNYPICVVEVRPPALPAIDVYPASGFSSPEEWGIWATGEESIARWLATNTAEARFAVEMFPYCVEGQPQRVEIAVAGNVLAAHDWTDCATWQTEIVIPAELVTIGQNEIDLQFAHADRPADVTGGANPDPRELSAGFTRFERLP